MKIALSIPGFGQIDPNTLPTGIPTGGLAKGQQIITVLIEFAAIAALGFALWTIAHASFNMITSGGDKERFAQGRNRLTFAIIGLLILMFSFFIVTFIGKIFNVPLIGPIPKVCTCTPWISNTCHVGGCDIDETFQSRTCNPAGCNFDTQCVFDPTCIAPPSLTVTVSAVPDSGPPILKSSVGFFLGGTAAGVWSANLYCDGVFGGNLNGTSGGSTFPDSCTFTSAGNHNADVTVTRDGVTKSGSTAITVN